MPSNAYALDEEYTDIPELTSEIVREFIEKVYIFHPEVADGKRTQKIVIVWNCIGESNTRTLRCGKRTGIAGFTDWLCHIFCESGIHKGSYQMKNSLNQERLKEFFRMRPYHRFVLRQKEGRRRMSSVNISRRPRSMERQRTAFTKSESGA